MPQERVGDRLGIARAAAHRSRQDVAVEQDLVVARAEFQPAAEQGIVQRRVLRPRMPERDPDGIGRVVQRARIRRVSLPAMLGVLARKRQRPLRAIRRPTASMSS